jgi:hypothetical protein
VTSFPARWALLAGATLVAACGSSEPSSPPIVDCSTAGTTTLAAGQAAIIDAASQGCVQLPAAGSGGAQYLYFAGLTDPTVTQQGLSADYHLTGAGGVAAARAAASRSTPSRPVASARQGASALAFHARLRDMERSAAREAGHPPTPPLAAARSGIAPPVLGEKRTFNVLANGTATGTKPSDYVQVTGTVAYVGSNTALYLDDAAPAPTYAPADLQAIGSLFNDQLYPIDTTAFGRESDIDGNGLVLILLTDRVTKLISCSGGSVVVGFFLPFDLAPAHVGSNAGEVFYGLVPDASCNIDVANAKASLPPVMIHEFQHMISYNQHVLTRGGSVEETWLNEGMSAYAEELGGRLVPDALCTNNDCLTQFSLINLDNASRYLTDPVSNYLIGPDRIPLPLEEYGAAWLFVRWLMDHYATTPTIGTDLTRKLDGTSRRGAQNVTQATGATFSSLVMDWQLANYLDDLAGFTPADPLLQYTSWNFPQTYASLHAQDPTDFPRAQPLQPPTAPNGAFDESGTLLAGSGRHVLVAQDPNAPGVSVRLTGSDSTTALPASVGPFVGVVRIR